MTKYRPNGHVDYGVSVVKNATCAFANNVGVAAHDQLKMSDHYDVTAYSPATHQNYVMHCVFDGAASITCTGGNDAEVEVGLNTGF